VEEAHKQSVASLRPGDEAYVAVVPSESVDDAFVLGRVVKVTPLQVTLQMANNEKRSVPVAEVMPAGNWTPSEESPDLCSLPALNEATVLAALQHRNRRGEVYTWVANLLISTNPCRPREDLYGQSIMQPFATGEIGKAPPHLYAVGEAAYRGATADSVLYPRTQQAIIVSGESGAGKSVAVKLLSEYLAWRAACTLHPAAEKPSEWVEEIGRVLLACRPALEALGNARTARNRNSSRFCKFVSIGMCGGSFDSVSISTYLLERSRVVHHDPAVERNFHVFESMLLGMSDQERREAALPHATVSEYAYLGGRRSAPPTGTSRLEAESRLADLRASLDAIGVKGDAQRGVFTLLGAVLCLGNVSFVEDDSGREGACIKDSAMLEAAAAALGVPAAPLKRYLTTRPVNGHATLAAATQTVVLESPLAKLLSPTEAARCRDSLAKAIYGNLFHWLVRRMNRALAAVRPTHLGSKKDAWTAPCKESAPASSRRANEDCIGLLDIFGFESFDTNSFEQLCINYANEQLHQLFVHTVFTDERAIHIAEGVPFPRLDLPDASSCIAAIAERPNGILWLLDSSTRLFGAREESFFLSANKEAARTKGAASARVLPVPRRLRAEEAFVIRHFAGDVTYKAGGAVGSTSPTWLDKNNSSLVSELHQIMLTSTSPLVVDIFGEAADRRRDSLAHVTPDSSRDPSPALKRPPASATQRVKDATLSSGARRLEVRSVARDFVCNLDELMGVLRASRLHFVRCVKPNCQLQPDAFSPSTVLRQLRCAGTHEAVQVMKLAYTSRVRYESLFGMISAVLPAGFDQRTIDRAYFGRNMIPLLGIPRGAIALGRTRVFLKPEGARELEESISRAVAGGARGAVAAPCLVVATEAARRWRAGSTLSARWRSHVARRQFVRVKRATVEIQRSMRRVLARKRFIASARRLAEEWLAREASEKRRVAAAQASAKRALQLARKEAEKAQAHNLRPTRTGALGSVDKESSQRCSMTNGSPQSEPKSAMAQTHPLPKGLPPPLAHSQLAKTFFRYDAPPMVRAVEVIALL